MSKIEISIEGMTCGHCAMTVTNELATLEGVSEDRLSAAIEEAGYQATGFASVNG